MLLIRYFLIGLIIYLIIRSFIRYGMEDDQSVRHDQGNQTKRNKKVSKEIGEYIDYEEVDK
jgi:hypothetical protein